MSYTELIVNLDRPVTLSRGELTARAYSLYKFVPGADSLPGTPFDTRTISQNLNRLEVAFLEKGDLTHASLPLEITLATTSYFQNFDRIPSNADCKEFVSKIVKPPWKRTQPENIQPGEAIMLASLRKWGDIREVHFALCIGPDIYLSRGGIGGYFIATGLDEMRHLYPESQFIVKLTPQPN